ncbi:MAG: hypothetical protein AB7K24_03370 [Gemmataceae bacterium]
MRLFVSLMVMALAMRCASAQCGPDGCRPPRAPTPTWHHFPDFDPDRLYLFRGTVQVGAFDLRERYFRAYDAASECWSDPVPEPPVALPPAYLERNFGVDRSRISPEERITCNGRPITAATAFELIQGSKIPDDAGQLRLTIIGPEELRQQVRDDLSTHPDLAQLSSRLVVQDYPPEHWAVARAGFYTGGQPTIYLQAPDGNVLHRQDSYGGPTELAAIIRRADPDYNKDRDPNLLQPALGRPETWPAYVWLLVGGAVLFFASRKERS